MNAQATIDSTSTTAASGDQDDPGSCRSAHTAAGDDGEGESASPGENREQLPPHDTHPDTAAQLGIEVLDARERAIPAVDMHRVAHLLRQAASHIARPIGRATIQLLDDAAITTLHREHCNINTTTDVLTFDASPPGDGPIEVDIAICVDEAARQATQRRHPLEHEVLLYALHGIMHCLGYDDHDDEGYRAMHAEEDRLLTRIGVGPVFAREGEQSQEGGGAS